MKIDFVPFLNVIRRYNREWRYHMEEKVWITQVAGMVITKKTTSYEEGTYYFFDPQNWRKVAKEFHLDYSKLEGPPKMNHPQMHMMHTHTAWNCLLINYYYIFFCFLSPLFSLCSLLPPFSRSFHPNHLLLLLLLHYFFFCNFRIYK